MSPNKHDANCLYRRLQYDLPYFCSCDVSDEEFERFLAGRGRPVNPESGVPKPVDEE